MGGDSGGGGSTQSQSPFVGRAPDHDVGECETLRCVPVWLRGAPWSPVSDLWVLAWPDGMCLAPRVRVISPQH